MFRILSIALYSTILFGLAVVYTPLYAQIPGGLGTESGSNLVMTPRFPEPGETIRLELNDYSLNTSGASFTWFVDGAELSSAKNERAITLTAKNSGEVTQVIAQTKLANGAVTEARIAIRPIRIDILIEADTLTPTFYNGRAIPSSGSLTRVTAIPFAAANRTPDSYSYLWRVGEEIIGGGSRLGKNSITFRSKFERTVEVSVDVIDTNGTVVTSKTTYVPITNPELNFYEVNPLEGIKEAALSEPYIFVGEEINVRAEPYFIDTTLMNNNPFVEWKLNSKTIDNQNSDRQEITLRRDGTRGSFKLEFHVRNLTQLLQGVKDSITFTF